MRVIAIVAACIGLSVACLGLAIAAEQAQAGSAGTESSVTQGDDLHFVSVMTLHGEVVAVDPANRLIKLKSADGYAVTLEARSEKDLAALKVGDRVVVRYFEGAQIRKTKPAKGIVTPSLKDGLLRGEFSASSKERPALVATIDAIDPVNQEITLKGPDGSLETILVTNPDKVHIKVGDQVVVTRTQALALSLEKQA